MVEQSDKVSGAARIRTAYVATAVIAFNVLVLIGVLNLASVGYFAIRDRSRPSSDAAVAHADNYGISLQALGSLYPGLSADDIGTLLEEAWVNNPMVFEPFTLFRERPRAGKFVNVRPEGFRVSANQGPWPPDRESYTTVFVFGGSTTFGYGVQDDETVVSHLQRLADEEPGAKPMRFYNFGRGYYHLTHERVLFQQLVSAGFVPDAAVFLDGLNDFAFPTDEPAGTDRFRSALESTRTFRQNLVGTLQTLPVTKAVTRAIQKFGGPEPPVPQAKTEALVLPGPDQEQLIQSVLDRNAADRKIVEAVAAAYSVRAYFAWQPVPTYKYDLRYHLFVPGGVISGTHALSGTGYAAMARVWPTSRNYIWCADLQVGLTEPLYVDPVHYSGAMNGRVAKCVAQGMKQP